MGGLKMIKNWVENILNDIKKHNKISYITGSYKNKKFVLQTDVNEKVYKILVQNDRTYRYEWDEIYKSHDASFAVERYEYLIKKVNDQKICDNLKDTKNRLRELESEAKKEGLI
jgi:hypothetical protein